PGHGAADVTAGTTVRLVSVQYRVEGLVLLACTILGIAAVTLAVAISPLVLDACGSDATPDACLAAAPLVAAETAATIAAAGIGLAVPALIALLIGVQLVGREIERGTAGLPWILGASRGRWFLVRVLVISVGVGGAGALLGLGNDLMVSAQHPGIDLGNSLLDWETRGWLLPARALALLGVGLLSGAVLGRVLPALLGALLIATLAFGGLQLGFGALHEAMAQPLRDAPGIYLADRYRDRTTGTLYAFDGADQLVGYDTAAFNSRFELIQYGLPDRESRWVVGSEVATLLVVFGLTTAAATAVVRRRRPY
ncbi:MAG: hypothetical protein ACRDGL_05055, partial [Candidatus Limnocylindrales bacterium]